MCIELLTTAAQMSGPQDSRVWLKALGSVITRA